MFGTIKDDLLNDKLDSDSGQRTMFQLVIISALAILVFLNIFQNIFVYDDPEIFLNWPAVKNMDIVKLLQGSYPAKFQDKAYRPIKGVIFAVEYKLWGVNTLGYHTQAILLNLAITLIVFFLIKAISKKSSIAFVAALLFGIHPVHTEAITFMTASLDTWGILFFFLSFLFYVKNDKRKEYFLLSYLFAFLAFFTYELTLTLPIIFVVYDICFRKINKQNFQKKITVYGGFFFLFALFFALRLHFIGQLEQGGYFAGSFYLTMLTMTKAVVKYLELMVLPINLSINPILSGGIESFVSNLNDSIPIKSQSIFNLDILFSIAIIISLISSAFILLRKKPIISFSIFFIFIALLPVLNVFPQQVVMAERYEYIASFGSVLIIGFLFNYLYNFNYKKFIAGSTMQNLLIVLLIGTVIAFSFLTIRRNTDWKNDLSIWTSLAEQPIGGALGSYYVGMAYFQKGDYTNAIANFKKTIARDSNNDLAYNFLTLSYVNEGRYDMAKATYDQLLNVSIKPVSQQTKDLGKIVGGMNQQKSSAYNLYSAQKFSFRYPSDWSISQSLNRVMLHNSQDNFWVNINSSTLPDGVTVDDYLNRQKQAYGNLANKGLAKIPTVDYAYVKIWNDNNVGKMQFFLFRNTVILEVFVYPSDSSEMQKFNDILASLKFNQ